MRRLPPRPMSSASLGSCVVLPEPVAPATITTWCRSSAAAISGTRAEIGSSAGNRILARSLATGGATSDAQREMIGERARLLGFVARGQGFVGREAIGHQLLDARLLSIVGRSRRGS